jgi:aldose 1-epimerase
MNQAAPPEGKSRFKPTGSGFSKSGYMTPCIVGLVCLGLLGAALERGHGNLKKITDVVTPPDDDVIPVTFRPGGQDPIRLSRSVTAIGRSPEFLSATLLPGRGMSVFQITAVIPGQGEIPILFSPSLTDAEPILTDSGNDAHGEATAHMGGALLLPWAGQLTGTPSETAGLLETTWNGSRLQFPAETTGSNQSVEGLLLDRKANSVRTDVLPDGQSAEAIFHAGSFEGALPSTVDVRVHVELTGHAIELTVEATNTGKSSVPFGAGWRPILQIPSGERANASLLIPSKTVLEKNKRTGLPTGKTLQVEDSPLDFSRVHGARLSAGAMDETFTRLQAGLALDGPVAELRDSAYNVALRIVPVSANITSLRVMVPANKPWVAIQPSTNVDDPLGPEWPDAHDAGLMTLEPGKTAEFKVRLEISSLVPSGSNLP